MSIIPSLDLYLVRTFPKYKDYCESKASQKKTITKIDIFLGFYFTDYTFFLGIYLPVQYDYIKFTIILNMTPLRDRP